MLREVVGFFAILWSMALFSADTELNFYRPMTETTKQLPLVITAKKPGECKQQSQLIKREDAWRCVAEGMIYDPCFVRPFGSRLEAVCLTSPWSTNAVQIAVVAPLDNQQHDMLDMSQTFPWAIELINGKKCQAIESTEQYEGLPVRYRCEGNTELIGHVQRCSSTWKILQHGSAGTDTVEIARAWF